MPYVDLAHQLKALGDPTRLRILEMLPRTKTCEGVYNVSELAEELNIPQPTVSHHLRILYQAELIKCERMCRDVFYWINEPAIESVMSVFQQILKHDPPEKSD